MAYCLLLSTNMSASTHDEAPQHSVAVVFDPPRYISAAMPSRSVSEAQSPTRSRSSSPDRGPELLAEANAATLRIAEYEHVPDEINEATMLRPRWKLDYQIGLPGRSYKSNLPGASVSLLTSLLPIYFLYFARLTYQQDGQPLEGNTQARWLLDAAAFVRFAMS